MFLISYLFVELSRIPYPRSNPTLVELGIKHVPHNCLKLLVLVFLKSFLQFMLAIMMLCKEHTVYKMPQSSSSTLIAKFVIAREKNASMRNNYLKVGSYQYNYLISNDVQVLTSNYGKIRPFHPNSKSMNERRQRGKSVHSRVYVCVIIPCPLIQEPLCITHRHILCRISALRLHSSVFAKYH